MPRSRDEWRASGDRDDDEEREDEEEEEDDDDEEEEDGADDEEDDDDWEDEDDDDWDDDDDEESSAVRIVVADEDEEARDNLVAALDEEGYEVVDLGDGEDLGDFLRTASEDEEDAEYPSLFIVSENAANEAALELLAEFRQKDWSTPIILTTTGDSGSGEEAERLGLTVVERPSDASSWKEVVKGLVTSG